MQALVYIFISLAGLAVAATAYFGLTFTPIESVLTGFVVVALAVVAFERTLRRRSEMRLEKAVGDLSRLLSTDAQAGQVLSQRINEMADVNAADRLETVEADLSVLGTVVRQVAEAVAEIEEIQEQLKTATAAPAEDESDRIYGDGAPAALRKPEIDRAITATDLKEALRQDRIVLYAQPIVTLPQRRVNAYEIMPMYRRDNGALADASEFMSISGGEAQIRQIERLAWQEAFDAARESRADDDALALHIPISRATLSDPDSVDMMMAQIDASRATAGDISFAMTEKQWRTLNAMERNTLSIAVERGVRISIRDARSLRLDFNELESYGVTSIAVEAERFIETPEKLTDFHASDIASYLTRFGIDLIVVGVSNEQQILSLLEDGVRFAQGNHFAKAGPAEAVLQADTIAEMRAEA